MESLSKRHWSKDDLEDDPHINLLETRAARESFLALTVPGDRVCCMLITGQLLPILGAKGVLRAIFYLRKLVFFGRKLLPKT